MKADPAAQLALLEVQEIDARAAQLRHQRSHLPELAEIAELEASRKAVDDEARDARIVVDDLSVEQAKVDADVEAVRTRRTRDRDRVDQGLVTNPKDLERMQRELESLDRRIGSLEDDELEVMEKLEEAQRTLAHLEERIAAHDERLAALAAERDRRWAEIDAELATVEGGRAAKADGLPDGLLALYDKLRAAKGGIGAAELRARQCGGCRLTLDNAELAVIARTPADQVVRCEECSRILVRAAESGL
ncbi:hypothetical protein G6553_12575 [Nocardioides sp. IC4_145]|nr:hypothetical protein [Nocardioides sp. IC4_145]